MPFCFLPRGSYTTDRNVKSLFSCVCLKVSVEYVGGLSDDMIADGLSQLGRSADGTLQVFLTLFLPVSFVISYRLIFLGVECFPILRDFCWHQ